MGTQVDMTVFKGHCIKNTVACARPTTFKEIPYSSPFYTLLAFALFGALAAFQESWASGTWSLEKGILHWVTWGWFNISDNELALVFLALWIKKKLHGFEVFCWLPSLVLRAVRELLIAPGSSWLFGVSILQHIDSKDIIRRPCWCQESTQFWVYSSEWIPGPSTWPKGICQLLEEEGVVNTST